MKPICVPCGLFFRAEKNGTSFIESMPKDGAWVPYKLWLGDQWHCLECGATIIVGVAKKPVAEHYHTNFDRAIKDFSPQVTINDC